MKQRKNIFLIGFMGTGKSTIAKRLAEELFLEYVEVDKLISDRENKMITQIFKEQGETYFRDLETSLLEEIQQKTGQIVSCGGGAILRETNKRIMNENGIVVLLNASAETIYERVKHSKDRPLLNENMNLDYIKQLYDKRNPLYLQAAQIVIDTNGKTIEDLCDEIKRKVYI
jgi:Shikimate kinase